MGWISRFIAACHRQHLPLDFISCHTYGCGQHRWPNGKSGLRVSGSPTAIAGGLHWTQQRIRRSAMPHLPLLITEWGPSYSSRDPVHDSYFQAVWLLQQVHAIKHPPLMMSYWALSDIFDEDGPQTMPFEGGFGIFNPEGIRKPSFVALAFLHRVQGRRLHTHDPESVAAISHRSLRILAWDYRWPTQTSSDSSYFSVPHPSVVARSIHLHVSHLHPGRYVVRIYREGYRHEDAYTLYQKWGRPQRLTAHQLAQLRRVTADRPVEKFMITVGPNGSWRRTLSLRSNGIALISIKPEGR
jgi:xylan 1,4-beta-xylosidase